MQDGQVTLSCLASVLNRMKEIGIQPDELSQAKSIQPVALMVASEDERELSGVRHKDLVVHRGEGSADPWGVCSGLDRDLEGLHVLKGAYKTSLGHGHSQFFNNLTFV